jgi:hypothetical protein
VNEETSPLNFILLINSILIIGLILNQNESTKDSVNKQTQNSSVNPFEKVTWIALIIQLLLLLIKVKINNS